MSQQMGEGQTGALITGASGVYFIPEDDLKSYRLPDAVAAEVRQFLQGEAGEDVAGFVQTKPPAPTRQPAPGLIAPVTMPTGPQPSSIMLHTATRW